MKPKDLLNDLEKGNRTKEFLKEDPPFPFSEGWMQGAVNNLGNSFVLQQQAFLQQQALIQGALQRQGEPELERLRLSYNLTDTLRLGGHL